MKRPSKSDEGIVLAVAKALAPEVLRWLETGGDRYTLEEVVPDLVKAMRFGCDGYDIARNLEQLNGYSPDAELVDILDAASTHQRHAVEVEEKEWLKTSGLTAPAIGATCRSKSRPAAGIGEVTRNYDTGRSTVFFADLGHVKEGTGTHGLVLVWEDLEMLP